MWPESAAILFEYCRTHYTSPEQAAEVGAESENVLVKARTSMAKKLWQNGSRMEARNILHKLCEDYPKNAHAWKDRGILEFKLKDLNTAETCFKQAIILNNDLSEAHEGLKVVLRHKNINR